MRATIQRDPEGGDVSELEKETSVEEGQEEEELGVKLVKTVMGASPKFEVDVSTYSGSLNTGELVDQINDMDKHFDYEEVLEDKKVNVSMTRLKGHASLWWDGVQSKRRKKGKKPIRSWDRMVEKLRGKFLPKDYQLSLYRQMQNLRKRMLPVREYTDEFYKVNIKACYTQDSFEKVARYINGLSLDLKYKLSLLSQSMVEEEYQCALNVQDKLSRNKSFSKGNAPTYRGKEKEVGKGKFSAQKD